MTLDILDSLPVSDTVRGIGGTDIRRILAGDAHSLWLEKTGRAHPEDLTWKLPVQIGTALEPVIRAFYEHLEDREVFPASEMGIFRGRAVDDLTIRHPSIPWALGRLDGVSQGVDGFRVWEAKTGNYWFVTKNRETFIQHHMPQVQWYMEVADLPLCDLTFLVDNSELVTLTIERDEAYAAAVMIPAAEEFWWHVIHDKEPPGAAAAAALAPRPKFSGTKTTDMTGNNAWASHAADWLANKEASERFAAAATELKALVPEDAKVTTGHGIIVKRAANHALSIKPAKE